MKAEGFVISLKLEGRRCLVVGSGGEAKQRAEALLEAGAEVTWVCPDEPPAAPDTPLDSSAIPNRAPTILAEYRPLTDDDLRGVRLAVLTDRNDALAARMEAACRAGNVLFCAVDQPGYGDYAHVAVVRQGPLALSISTNGRAPALARRIRQELSRLFHTNPVAAFVAELEALRERTPRAERANVMNRAAARLSFDGRLTIQPPDHSNSGKPDSGSGAG